MQEQPKETRGEHLMEWPLRYSHQEQTFPRVILKSRANGIDACSVQAWSTIGGYTAPDIENETLALHTNMEAPEAKVEEVL